MRNPARRGALLYLDQNSRCIPPIMMMPFDRLRNQRPHKTGLDLTSSTEKSEILTSGGIFFGIESIPLKRF